MKTIIFSLVTIFVTFFSMNSYAADMSKTESWKDAYKSLSDGSSEYIGKCSTHQDFENKKFIVTKTLVEYFEPLDVDADEIIKKFKNVEPQLIAAASGDGSLISADDITLETIKSTVIPGLDLYRFNIGVGGGNGMFLVFNRTIKNGIPAYQLVSNIFDGDVEFCDSLVWIK